MRLTINPGHGAMKRCVLGYLLLLSLVALLSLPLELALVAIGAMASDTGSAAMAYGLIGVLALIPLGSLACLMRSWCLYHRQCYSAAIGWSVLPTLLILGALLLYSHQFWLILLAGLWLGVGVWMSVKS